MMTVYLSGNKVAKQLTEHCPEAVAAVSDSAILVKSEFIFNIAEYLKNSPELDFNYLNYITAVDYYDYFELIYQLTSLQHNHTLVLKTRCYDRDNAVIPSVVSLWRGANLQEREIYDLLGISFEGHPNLKRLVLWEGFKGHPLRKEYL
ncbi:NADH-quinone oxidoreductase subunit C [Chloroflexota bacterium]